MKINAMVTVGQVRVNDKGVSIQCNEARKNQNTGKYETINSFWANCHKDAEEFAKSLVIPEEGKKPLVTIEGYMTGLGKKQADGTYSEKGYFDVYSITPYAANANQQNNGQVNNQTQNNVGTQMQQTNTQQDNMQVNNMQMNNQQVSNQQMTQNAGMQQGNMQMTQQNNAGQNPFNQQSQGGFGTFNPNGNADNGNSVSPFPTPSTQQMNNMQMNNQQVNQNTGASNTTSANPTGNPFLDL
ncbi:hypothetical protein bpr_II304 (plasmid) [Butyrivibrio proteoclasticus B316]|uniref:Uncharacterized protein n=1 Tax=Butyrivibrio proteoclasticus (strain ATCC 51982 / DSM 14932 / B316) TaxID=515622 RepID=E0S4A9_BUTPB|nr:hypothetical protein [Butyrivibrio proteoclasticus]ADL36241.1 hypothetical protein bpr_II304 [Butyrivibrio proteoclasticus B316]